MTFRARSIAFAYWVSLEYNHYGCTEQPHGFRRMAGVLQTPRMHSGEKRAFAERLKLALTRGPKAIRSSAELAVEFNLRHRGDPVTQQAVHKWLSGRACPTPDKIETLAAWLGVSARWLSHGAPDDPVVPQFPPAREPDDGTYASAAADAAEARLLAGIRRLSPHQRRLILELVDQLLLERDNRPAP